MTTYLNCLKICTLLLCISFLGGCYGGVDGGSNESKLPPDWAAEVNHPVLKDEDPSSSTVEVNLQAIEKDVEFMPGKKTKAWTYNGVVPGPVIRAKVGDRLIVNFTNYLPEETTVHWHGVELPANMDGSNLAQLPVQPGETFTYDFELLRAGTYWYHPHIKGDEQVEKGLHGALIVDDVDADSNLALPENELTLVIDDILLDDNGQLLPVFPDSAVEKALRIVNGREGNILTVNGKQNPKIKVVAGKPVRIRFINTANVRFQHLTIAGHDLYQIGGDNGLLPTPVAIDKSAETSVLLTPGERADIVFTPQGKMGDTFDLIWNDFARGRHSAKVMPTGMIMLGDAEDDGKRPAIPIANFEVVGETNAGDYVPPQKLNTIEKIDTTGAEKLSIMFGHTMPDMEGNLTYFAATKMVDGKMMGIPFDQLQPEDAIQAQVGETYIWEVTNMTGGAHNFHPHGFSFQPIEVQYMDMETPENNKTIPFDRVEWKDTILIPARLGAMGKSRTIVRLAVKFDDVGREGTVEAFGKNPTATSAGGWVAHCHLLEHADRGMMNFVNLRY